MKGKKVLLIDKEGKRYILGKGEKFQSKDGVVEAKKFGILKSHRGENFICLPANFSDMLAKARRGPQVVLPKDAGIIFAHSGIDRNSKVIDAGCGSGWLSAQMARTAKKVFAYEARKDFAQIARKNFEYLGLKNIVLKEKDISKGFDEKNIDLLTFDVPEPWKFLEQANKSLKVGGVLAAYLPQITQVVELAKNLGGSWLLEKVCEVLERDWLVDESRARPSYQMLGHTGFLVFARKIF